MKLLLNERKQILAINNSIEYGVWGNLGSLASWKIGNLDFMRDDNYSLIEINEELIPIYVQPGKYYFINDSFQLAEDPNSIFIERNNTIEELKTKLNNAEDIKTLKSILNEVLRLLEK